MKKILLIIAIFLINIPVVLAENSAYLSELSVGQGELSPSFDKNNNTYTIDIDDDVTKLDINYTLEDDNATVEILDNDLITEKNHTVTIKISNNEEIQIYKILVNKIKNESVDKKSADSKFFQKFFSDSSHPCISVILCNIQSKKGGLICLRVDTRNAVA